MGLAGTLTFFLSLTMAWSGYVDQGGIPDDKLVSVTIHCKNHLWGSKGDSLADSGKAWSHYAEACTAMKPMKKMKLQGKELNFQCLKPGTYMSGDISMVIIPTKSAFVTSILKMKPQPNYEHAEKIAASIITAGH